MTMKKNRLFIILFLGILITQITGCTKFVTVDPPVTQLVTSSVFENDQTAIAAMNGIYSFMESNAGFSNGGTESVGFFGGLSADELTNYSSSPEQIQFYQNELNSSNSELYSSLWQTPYQCIYDANGIIEGVSKSTNLSSGVKQELLGEAKFIRAFCNFYLTNLFGDIPLINTTDYKANESVPRTGRQSVYQQIITDLTEAQSLLSSDYSFSGGEKVKPNSWVATAFLARVYLFNGNWKDAENMAAQVIGQVQLFALDS